MILGFGLMIHVGQKGRNSSIAYMILCERQAGLWSSGGHPDFGIDSVIEATVYSHCAILAERMFPWPGPKYLMQLTDQCLSPFCKTCSQRITSLSPSRSLTVGDKVQTAYPVGSEIRTAV